MDPAGCFCKLVVVDNQRGLAILVIGVRKNILVDSTTWDMKII